MALSIGQNIGVSPSVDSSGASTAADSSLLGTLASLGGLGLSAYNQQSQYGVLQNALNTIGPTALNGYSLAGPGGMSSSYNQNGGANISLGSLSPAFGNLAGVAGAGSANYNPSLLSNLTNTANGTLSPALSNLNSAYGNYNTAMGAANTQLGALNQTYNQTYNNTLNSLQAIQQPQVQQQAFGLQNTLFGNGTLNSTGAASGALAAGNFGSQVNAMNAQDALTAQQQALSAQSAGVQNYGSLANSANGILSNAFTNFGNTNQLISGLNTAQLNNSLSAVQGTGALNTTGLNNYNAALQTGMGQATARNQSLFPYASVATALAGTPNASSILASALSGAGGSLGSNGLGSLLNNVSNPNSSLMNSLFGSNFTPMTDSAIDSSLSGQLGSSVLGSESGVASDVSSDLASELGSFSSAGGQAAASAALPAGVAPAVTDASIQAGVDTGAAAGAGGSSAATSAGLGALAGGALAIGGVAAPLIAGLATPAVSLSGSYWNGLQQGLQSPKGSQAYNAAADELQGIMTNGTYQLPSNIQALANQLGISALKAPNAQQLQMIGSLGLQDSYAAGGRTSQNKQ